MTPVSRTHASNAVQKKTANFLPKRDGPYIIVIQRSPTTYEVANPNNLHDGLGPYNSTALRPCIDKEATPVILSEKEEDPGKEVYWFLIENDT
ncbi:hypothetical protein TNIN_78891 [Trichonephila inaurata madagascariensis]|uniref:Uncharacterized protein n=1 Tax=Trichonephila inaurata madagascariensis TaxID=2747483 RepID=A0A8X7CA10_9ARAC|nr:hypothetical protein TNIN_78891 [Trichonephila inaurata madagascariensis]